MRALPVVVALALFGRAAAAQDADGASCADASTCTSNHCVDGVCCDVACDGACVACAALKKESLGGDGVCGPALSGTDPHSDCAVEPGCGKNGECDGAGACMLRSLGTACGATACVINNVTGMICDGRGACYDQTAALPCSPYACTSNACQAPCKTDSDCVLAQAMCEGGICKSKRAAGKPCASPAQCTSGSCTDGVCCGSSCAGQCEACNLPGKIGTCLPVTGVPVGGRQPCGGSGACAGTCDGRGRNSCSYPGQGTVCGAASCAGNTARAAAGCDGKGVCATPLDQACAPYGCDPSHGACFARCGVDSECATGSTCDRGQGSCVTVLGAHCEDSFTLVDGAGHQSSCAPYRCLSGACQQQCASSNDCAPGTACVSSRCVPMNDAGAGAATGAGGTSGAAGEPSSGGAGGGPSTTGGMAGAGAPGTAPQESSGCACRAPGPGRTNGGLLWSLGMLFGVRALRVRLRAKAGTP